MEFSFKRFFALWKRYFYRYISLIFFLSVLAFSLGICAGYNDDGDRDLPIMIITLFMFLTFYISYCPEYTPKDKKNILLLPASTLEKCLSSIFMGGIFAPLLVGCIIQIGIYIGYSYSPYDIEPFNVFVHWFGQNTGKALLIYGTYLSFMICTSSFVPMGGFVATYLAAILFFVPYIKYEDALISTIANDNPQCLEIFESPMSTFQIWAYAISIPVFLALTYLRLKEERL